MYLITKNLRSHDLDDIPRPPPEVPPGTKGDRAAKQDSQGENLPVKTEKDSSKTTLVMLNVKRMLQGQRKQRRSLSNAIGTKLEYQPIAFVPKEVKKEGWQLDL